MLLENSFELPDELVNVLKEVQVYDPKAILAGGCLRDIFYGRPYKDVDIFTRVMPDWEGMTSSGMDYEGMKYVQAVAEIRRDDAVINLILVEANTENWPLIESFDFGFCQIGFDGTQLMKTPGFEGDYKHGRITLYYIDRYPRSIRRYAGWATKYSGMEIAIPQLEVLRQKKVS